MVTFITHARSPFLSLSTGVLTLRRACRTLFCGLAALLLCMANCYARPDMTPLGPNIADTGSAFYHFTVNTFDSVDGQRHYKVWTAIPNKKAPAAGYPALYLLDGNAVMDKLSESMLQKLYAGNAPVLVVIGYQTSLPFDVAARAWDYIPATQAQQPNMHGRTGGGSAIFRTLLEKTIAPQAEKGLSIDAQKRALWGHSYGGVFVLDSFLSSEFFRAYYSAVPSLAGAQSEMLQAIERHSAQSEPRKSLWLLEGDGDNRSRDENATLGVLAAVRETVSRLNQRGIPAHYLLYPGLSHGAMFAASMEFALLHLSGAPLPQTE